MEAWGMSATAVWRVWGTGGQNVSVCPCFHENALNDTETGGVG